MDNIKSKNPQEEYLSWRRTLRSIGNMESARGRALAQAVSAALTARQAQMVSMYYLQQHSMADIAQMLGVNPSTVSRALKSSREKLQRSLCYGLGASFGDEED